MSELPACQAPWQLFSISLILAFTQLKSTPPLGVVVVVAGEALEKCCDDRSDATTLGCGQFSLESTHLGADLPL